MKHIYFIVGLGRILVLITLFVFGISTAQGIEVPKGDNKELDSGTVITTGTIADLSFIDPPSVWKQGYTVSCTKANQCVRKARRFIKKKNYIDGLAYAARTFILNPKKRATRKALEILTQGNYALALKEFEQNQKDFPDLPIYENWRSSRSMYYRMWFFNRMYLVNTMLSTREHPKINITIDPIESNTLSIIAKTLSSYRTLSAQEYYNGAQYYLKKASASTDKNQYKRAAVAFRIANEYVTDFKDAKSQYESAKKLAMSTVYFSGHYYKSGGFGGTLDEDVKAALLNIRGFNGLRFIEITNSKSADYHVKLVTNGLELVTRGKTSDKQEFSKEIKDKNGKVVTKKATVTTYTSGYNARAKINVEVISRKTNKVMYSTVSERTYQWTTVWQKGTGDLNIVKSRYKQYVGNSPDRAPQRRTLYERAIGMCATDIAHQLYSHFLRRVGASPTH